MPTVLRKDGYQFFFYANERQEPAHVHVYTGSGAAKWWLDPVSVAHSKGFSPRQNRQIREIILAHRIELRKAWDDFFRQ